MSENKARWLFLLSDGTGVTVDKAVQAVLKQYSLSNLNIQRYKKVRSREQVRAIAEEAQRRGALLVYTIVIDDIRKELQEAAKEFDIKHVDLLGSVLDLFSGYLDLKPLNTPGLLHQVNEEYFKRIEAIEFTVRQDDGNSIDNLKKADLVLLGVSRTSKTPLSIYLSHRGYKVANVPLIKDIPPPDILDELDHRKVIALTIDPHVLVQIRKKRMLRLGQKSDGSYCSLKDVVEEVEWAQHYFNRHKRWVVFDVTNKALEEVATDIERRILQKNRF